MPRALIRLPLRSQKFQRCPTSKEEVGENAGLAGWDDAMIIPDGDVVRQT